MSKELVPGDAWIHLALDGCPSVEMDAPSHHISTNKLKFMSTLTEYLPSAKH